MTSATSPSASPAPSEADLQQRWTTLLGPGGFACRSLWTSWFDADDAQLRLLVPVDELPSAPDAPLLAGLGEMWRTVVEDQAPGGSVAVALCRPGPGVLADDDRAWLRAAVATAREVGVRLRRSHLATRGRVQPVALDDLLP